MKRPWHVDEIKIVEGCEFMQLTLRDKHFVIFVFGLDVVRHNDYLQQLRNLRTEATIKLKVAVDVVESLFGNQAAAPGYREQKRRRLLNKSDRMSIVTIAAPGADNQARDIKVLAAVNRIGGLWVEAKGENLDFVRTAILQTKCDSVQVDSPSVVKGVVWRADRKAFIAKNKNGYFKTFRPDGDDDDSKQLACEKAAAWTEDDSEQ